ncbi:bifunctional phosphoribosylaminoimidazolecarboxamide formyltransferase/IMP cyclohydrolase [Treponema sp. OMZ 799]|uniref:bifunctional phosphoribosylaminoimidazolecarboxamide formyltransferase/IMP cyclohydrolase n=1 Tax=Treponema sp. OMZ 799 TaxID=2563668 RepID=UPI0020A58ABD|nr:bifunctional phosphoribosylaminoimidazolecarboxamide formyltransferase/IMP cyclohydrolase [Treponema sp. OMZ 799]UTC78291.1 bifunctional phosphoribosylaminoimidazolecarboxamide formyltransferase/IMP cyclohydrolase [Treponema sp. OMZ 799]
MGLVLASVSDKTGLKDFAACLKAAGYDFIASGGTAKTLEEAGIKVKEVSEYTSSPEILGGRVKTLHPMIHGGILARDTEEDRAELKALGFSEIDIVIANLYPFEKTISSPNSTESDCIENIDIGGVALLRAAAKNYSRVAIICDPADYDEISSEIEKAGEISLSLRKRLAIKAFDLCTRYDAAITSWLSRLNRLSHGMEEKTSLTLCAHPGQDLRYGENPHQRAWLYTNEPKTGPLGGRVLQGKELSYNNILDADAAWRAVSMFTKPAAVVVKHLTPCGLAEINKEDAKESAYSSPHSEVSLALRAAIDCDPVSAFGSIIALNRPFDKASFETLGSLFVECIIAPLFTEEAKELLSGKKNLRLIEAPFPQEKELYEYKSVLGGFLKQEKDLGDPESTEYKDAASRKATPLERSLLQFAMKACTMVKSNAILLAAPIDASNPQKGFCSVGIGCGQPNRVDAARQAIERAGERVKDAVLASDAFFPFPDTIEEAGKAGIKAVIQPGGSIRDDLSIEECNKHGMAMLVTGVRHFKH